jgi:zinc and cadmium transporter
MLATVFLHLLEHIEEYNLTIGIFAILGIIAFFILEKYIHWHHCHKSDHDCDSIKPVGYLSLFADAIHNLLDGVLIAAGYGINIQTGIATTISVIIHEIPQEIADFGLLLHSGFSKTKALLFNFISALTAFLGAGLYFILTNSFEKVEPFLIAFAIGGFLYIAMSDLIPTLHEEKEFKKSILQFVLIILGIIIVALL